MRSRNTSFFDLLIFYGTLTAFVGSVIAVFIFLLLPTQKQQEDEYTEQVPEVLTQPLTTDTWALFDTKTGIVLAGKNLDAERPIASVSKLFTAVAVMKSDKQNDAFTITEADISTEGRSGKLQYGEMVTPYMLLFPLLIESSNDAATAIARYLDDEFKAVVSKTTESLALTHTRINEPSGLSPKDISSARDLALFYSYVARTYPHILDITRLKMYVALRTGYINNNPAAAIPSFSGGKHGFTPEAGKTFVGAFHNEKTGAEIGVVLLGSTDLLHDIEILKTQGVQFANASDIMTP
jgi:serine-type D-Ala-D-Ala carboxypeptidase (penicillin-binding protein 5/6)